MSSHSADGTMLPESLFPEDPTVCTDCDFCRDLAADLAASLADPPDDLPPEFPLSALISEEEKDQSNRKKRRNDYKGWTGPQFFAQPTVTDFEMTSLRREETEFCAVKGQKDLNKDKQWTKQGLLKAGYEYVPYREYVPSSLFYTIRSKQKNFSQGPGITLFSTKTDTSSWFVPHPARRSDSNSPRM